MSGRRRATIFEHQGGNGTYTGAGLDWEGRDDRGDPLPPGLYLVQLRVEGDARSTSAVRALGIAY